MVTLLNATKPYIDKFHGIRISTRPDYIDDDILSLLKSYGVTSIELGAQSMCDDVLSANERGHNSDSVIKASTLIKQYGFSLGLQMMTGLYKSDNKKDIYTAQQFINLAPETVRIYPTIVMKDTKLAALYSNGEYSPQSLCDAVTLCATLAEMFEKNNIKVIRLGLHYSDSLINTAIDGPYHPAFGEMCTAKIFLNKIYKQIEEKSISKGEIEVLINPKDLSKILGQKKSNFNTLLSDGYKMNVLCDASLTLNEVIVKQRG